MEYVVLVQDIDGGGVTPFGPYSTLESARSVVDRMRDPQSPEYYDPMKYYASLAWLRKHEYASSSPR